MLFKAIDAVVFFVGSVFLTYYPPYWAFQLLKRFGIVSRPDRERNEPDEERQDLSE
jgi:hypothetical protein